MKMILLFISNETLIEKFESAIGTGLIQALHLKQGRGLNMDIIQSSTTMIIIPVSGYNKSDYQNTVAKRVQFHKFENCIGNVLV